MLTALTLLLLFVCVTIVLSLQSQRPPTENSKMYTALRPCPNKPNCVCSEDTERSAAIAPIVFTGSRPDIAWKNFKQTVNKTGGSILKENSHYLWAVYKTPLFRFADDLEARLDETQHRIHIRSASRIGHSDFGTNRSRVERIRTLFYAKTEKLAVKRP